jgi:hypothetical protein
MSIEGSTLIIATCIPTLQPLLEILLRRKGRKDYSSNGRRRYSSSRSGQHKTDFELRHKPQVIRPRNELDSIMGTRYDDTESQETITGPSETQRVQSQTDGILKTDEVTITYGAEG